MNIAIPLKTMSLLDKFYTQPIGVPVTAKTPEAHSVPAKPATRRYVPTKGPWREAPPPSADQSDDMHLFKLTVNKDKKKSWRIDVTDLNTGRTINHASGFKAPVSMDGQFKSGEEFADGI